MKRALLLLLLIPPMVLGNTRSSAEAQTPPSLIEQGKPRVLYITPKSQQDTATLDKIRNQSSSGATIALWSYSVVAYDGKTYQGQMVGRSAFAHGHRITTIPTFVIPVALTFADTGFVFDPSQPDGCISNDTVDELVLNSPIFQNVDYIMNGVDVGSTQYLDAFQRANFWTYTRGLPYHTVFSTTPTVLPTVSVTVPVADGVTQSGLCGYFGQMDQAWWDSYLQTTIFPSLTAQGVGPTNFPQFIFDSVAMSITSGCCALGYHNSFFNGGVFQTYAVNDFDTSGAFGGDTSAMSHEVAEWMDDPAVTNPVPAWGAEGQVQAGSCQNNLEVGDPLSPNFGTPTNPFYATMPNGFTYTLQELAFFSWFYGSTPSLGAGGGYSDDGTFTGYAKPCPPGGTN